MPGRGGSSEAYRYGFNGKEKDDDGEFGSQTNLDFGARIYNPAIGRWLSTDPLAANYTSWSPYNFVMGNPIKFIDPDGMRVETDYYDTKGNLQLSTDDGSDNVVILDQGFEGNFSIFKESLKGDGHDLNSPAYTKALSSFGVTYDMKAINSFFSDSKKNKYDNNGSNYPLFVNGDGGLISNTSLPKETAVGLRLGENGIVTTGDNSVIGKDPISVPSSEIIEARLSSDVSWLHTEPIDHLSHQDIWLRGTDGTDDQFRTSGNPSKFDREYYKNQTGYLNVIGRENETIFFGKGVNFSIPKK